MACTCAAIASTFRRRERQIETDSVEWPQMKPREMDTSRVDGGRRERASSNWRFAFQPPIKYNTRSSTHSNWWPDRGSGASPVVSSSSHTCVSRSSEWRSPKSFRAKPPPPYPPCRYIDVFTKQVAWAPRGVGTPGQGILSVGTVLPSAIAPSPLLRRLRPHFFFGVKVPQIVEIPHNFIRRKSRQTRAWSCYPSTNGPCGASSLAEDSER